MKRTLLAALIITATLASMGQAQAEGVRATRFGSATLDPIGDSAVRARIAFIDNGVDLIVLGTATGLNTSNTFISNIYDIGSVGRRDQTPVSRRSSIPMIGVSSCP